jgi:hypothetical protein
LIHLVIDPLDDPHTRFDQWKIINPLDNPHTRFDRLKIINPLDDPHARFDRSEIINPLDDPHARFDSIENIINPSIDPRGALYFRSMHRAIHAVSCLASLISIDSSIIIRLRILVGINGPPPPKT